ncbi:twin-arginine translocase subunit TatC [Leifsonia sp. NPDC056824]|uniref:twin-arginine translocase subunit TatC n=1 Tax=Leifsonia sp. NPDC056824 TaxID=3345953 RepID=UPI0036BF3D89
MSLGAHLGELRRRLARAAGGFLLGSVAGWFLSAAVLDAIREPILAVAQTQHRMAQLNFSGITAAFDLRLQIALMLGAVLSSPIWLYQVWAFFVPAMTRREFRYTFGFFASAVPLFLVGCAAGAFVVPRIVVLMTGFAPAGSSSLLDAPAYFSFVLKLVLVVGVAFVLPVFLVLLDFVGVITAAGIIRSWRIAAMLIVLFTAIATPAADVMSMLLLAIPLVALFFLAAGVAWIHDRRAARRLAAQFLI